MKTNKKVKNKKKVNDLINMNTFFYFHPSSIAFSGFCDLQSCFLLPSEPEIILDQIVGFLRFFADQFQAPFFP